MNKIDSEKHLITAFNEIFPVNISAHRILDMIFRVKSDMKISILAKHLSDFEVLIGKILGDLGSYLVYDIQYPEFLKIQKFKLYLYCKLILLYIYYCFYVYYDRKNVQLSLFYLKKLLVIILYELAGLSGNLYYNCDRYFRTAFVLIVTPILEVFAPVNLLLCQFRIRLNSMRMTIVKKNSARNRRVKPSLAFMMTLYKR